MLKLTHLSEESVVRLVLDWHEHDEDTVKELNALQCSDTHIKENTEENCHRNLTQDGCHHNRQPNEDEDGNVSQAVFPEKFLKI